MDGGDCLLLGEISEHLLKSLLKADVWIQQCICIFSFSVPVEGILKNPEMRCTIAVY